MARKKKVEFEQALQELETLVQQLEQGDLSLEASLSAFEQGIALARECQQTLSDAEQRVHLVLEQNGQVSKPPFQDDI
ncbi:exodeoxyribonuclease VII small subunit [Pokkaliibacter plantistimulans]|uniref:Exodeoxyribonuclease 7 small subunit n=2 Tax=Pseudomonadota TaxID=1224 RepID=A0ABX5M254_9GAMM|nr:MULTISPECIES: exodeoxyribonuclease VII small subunit [Pokkaliibacter]MDH2433862.1 exodeoxyribonuclease VII small subunit [Pokkaliibacter sp. MBI-7]PPC76938.1 exodeoxyribonuclease VII small subunit [Pokkaliibacter plantistimulans]PXF32997.1 exodeoxyribonuclease VII small subunit [Pokkaliibacter plantistimulans]